MPEVTTMDALIGRAFRDGSFRKQIMSNPEALAAEYGLSPAEVAVVVNACQETQSAHRGHRPRTKNAVRQSRPDNSQKHQRRPPAGTPRGDQSIQMTSAGAAAGTSAADNRRDFEFIQVEPFVWKRARG